MELENQSETANCQTHTHTRARARKAPIHEYIRSSTTQGFLFAGIYILGKGLDGIWKSQNHSHEHLLNIYDLLQYSLAALTV